jgi:hypothetical protein
VVFLKLRFFEPTRRKIGPSDCTANSSDMVGTPRSQPKSWFLGSDVALVLRRVFDRMHNHFLDKMTFRKPSSAKKNWSEPTKQGEVSRRPLFSHPEYTGEAS